MKKLITVLTKIACVMCVYPISIHRRGRTVQGFDQIFRVIKQISSTCYLGHVSGRYERGLKAACHLQELTGQFTACVQTFVAW